MSPSRQVATPQGMQDWQLDEEGLIVNKEEPIGKGAYGELYKGSYFDSEVAIKVLRKNGEKFYQAFLKVCSLTLALLLLHFARPLLQDAPLRRFSAGCKWRNRHPGQRASLDNEQLMCEQPQVETFRGN
jgi:hypothetical protein